MDRQWFFRSALAGYFTFALALPAAAKSTAVADFYAGKTIEVYVAGGAGGGYGLYARVVSKYLQRYIPGNPTLTPKFMPGGRGAKAINYLYNIASKDGLALGAPLSVQPTTEALARPGIRYASNKLHWIGRMTDIVTVVTIKNDAPATTIAGIRKSTLVAGTTGVGSTTHMAFAIMNWALDTKFKIVAGYKNTADISLAYEQGEVHAIAAPWGTVRARRPALLQDVQLVQVGLAKDSEAPEVSLLVDLVTDPKKKAAVAFLSAEATIGRTLVAPPGVPAGRVIALRHAFDAAMKDPELVAEVMKRKMGYNPMSGAALEKVVREHMDTRPDVIALAKKAAGFK